MSKKTDYILKALHVISWIIFIGVCIEAGGFIFNAFTNLILTPAGAEKFWTEVNLSELYNYNISHYITMVSLMIIVAVMRAVMFWIIVKFFYNNGLNMAKPFNETLRRFVSNIAYLALGIGLFSFWGAKFAAKLVSEGVKMPELQYLRVGGADVWLFMGITLLVIAHIFKKGIEMQNENDLTV